MKKIIYYLLGASFLLGACNDDNVQELPEVPITNPETISSDLRDVTPSVEILTCGLQDSIYVETDQQLEFALYVVTTENDPDAFKYTTLKGSTLYLRESNDITFSKRGNYIVSSEVPFDAASAYILSVMVKGTDRWYPIIMPVRYSMLTPVANPNAGESDGNSALDDDDYYTNSATPTTADEIRSMRAASFLCHPVYPDSVASVNGSVTWLNKEALVFGSTRRNSAANGYVVPGIMTNTKEAQTWRSENSGKNTEKHSKSNSVEAGFSALLPLAKLANLNISASFKRDESSTSSTEREWYKWTLKGVGMTASIDKTELVLNSPFYLGKGLNNVLNGTNPKMLELYPETEEGAFKILDTYGLFLCTTGTFGAYCSYKYERQANVSSEKVEWAAKMDLALKSQPDSASAATTASTEMGLFFLINSYFGINLNKWYAKANASLTFTDEHYKETVNATTQTVAFGGNCLTQPDMTKWSPTDDPENWNLIYFNTNNHLIEDDRNLVCILDLIQDTDKKRYMTLKKALTGSTGLYADDCPYAMYLKKKYPIYNPEYRTVLADIVAVNTDKGVNDLPKSCVMTDPFGKRHIYHPFIINQNAGFLSSGLNNNKCMEGYGLIASLENKSYIEFMDYTPIDLHLNVAYYYAMDDYKNCNGISDIVVAAEGMKDIPLNNGYISRGSYDNFWKNTQTRIYVKYTTEKDPDYPYITGVALVDGRLSHNKADISNWRVGWPMASTMGTEQTLTNNTANDFFWNPNTADSIYTSISILKDKSTCGLKDGVYTFGVTGKAKCPARKGTNTPGFELFNSSNDISTYYNCQSSVIGCPSEKTYYPILFGTSSSEFDKYGLFVNYTTRRLEGREDILSEPRTAKSWPYSESK